MTFNSAQIRPSVYCHRGFWRTFPQQNSVESFDLASENGFSIETDIRFFEGSAVVCHDLPIELGLSKLDELSVYSSSFALNVKEDGLQNFFVRVQPWMEATNSFVFDGSIPEMFRYRELGINHALRLSEYEKSLSWQSGYIWLDSFHDDWWLKDQSILNTLQDSQIIVVSPELHGRDPRFVWDFLSNERSIGRFDFSICTDKPLEYLSWN